MDQYGGTIPGGDFIGGNRVDRRCMKRPLAKAEDDHQTHTVQSFAGLRSATSTPYAHLWITLWTVETGGRKVPCSLRLRRSTPARAATLDRRREARDANAFATARAAKRAATGLARATRFFYPHDWRFCCGYVHK
jgi:hypothetical protein